MKKWIIIAIVVLVAILVVPIPRGTMKDGGTREFTALTYKIVDWNRITEDIIYQKTSVYFFPNNFTDTETLWQEEINNAEFTAEWLDDATAEEFWREDTDEFWRDDVWFIIVRIYSNCFFVEDYTGNREIKINGELSDEWCVNDKVKLHCDNWRRDPITNRQEADLVSIQPMYSGSGEVVDKPVIYLYPEETQQVSVKINFDGMFTCTYPAYGQGWNVIASPDGTLTDAQGQVYNYLYWEGKANVEWDMSRGFCVKGEDTAKFLDQALEQLGLNRREANEFIVYWLPMMEQNPYNIISFQTDVYAKAAELEIDPVPDTLIRVFMAWQGVDSPVELPEQKLSAPTRQGFTVVEWGGTEIK